MKCKVCYWKYKFRGKDGPIKGAVIIANRCSKEQGEFRAYMCQECFDALPPAAKAA